MVRRGGNSFWLACVALYDLVMGNVTSYAKARAESLGMTANVGIAERADRLVAVLVATGLAGLGVPFLLPAVLCLLAVASTVTVVQRILAVRAQALANERGSGQGSDQGSGQGARGATTGGTATGSGTERPGAEREAR